MKFLNYYNIWMCLENTLGLLYTKSKIRLIKKALLDCFISIARLLEIVKTVALIASIERRLSR
jgi:hypothetical protein